MGSAGAEVAGTVVVEDVVVDDVVVEVVDGAAEVVTVGRGRTAVEVVVTGTPVVVGVGGVVAVDDPRCA